MAGQHCTPSLPLHITRLRRVAVGCRLAQPVPHPCGLRNGMPQQAATVGTIGSARRSPAARERRPRRRAARLPRRGICLQQRARLRAHAETLLQRFYHAARRHAQRPHKAARPASLWAAALCLIATVCPAGRQLVRGGCNVGGPAQGEAAGQAQGRFRLE